MFTAVLGWVGTLGTFSAYLLVSQGRLRSESLAYAWLNAAGGLLGGTASALYGAWPSATSNFVWAALGLHAIAKHHRGSRLQGRSSDSARPVDGDAPCRPEAGSGSPQDEARRPLLNPGAAGARRGNRRQPLTGWRVRRRPASAGPQPVRPGQSGSRIPRRSPRRPGRRPVPVQSDVDRCLSSPDRVHR